MFGAFTLPAYAIAAAHTFDHADRADYVEVSAGLLLANNVGAAIGPLVASTLMMYGGPAGLFEFVLGMQLLLGGFLLSRLWQRESPTAVEKDHFDLVNTAPVLAVADNEAIEIALTSELTPPS